MPRWHLDFRWNRKRTQYIKAKSSKSIANWTQSYWFNERIIRYQQQNKIQISKKQNYQYDVKIHKGSFLYANFHNYHKIQTNFLNIYTIMVLTNAITCSILIFKITQNKIKKTYPQTVLQHHRTGLYTKHAKMRLCYYYISMK